MKRWQLFVMGVGLALNTHAGIAEEGASAGLVINLFPKLSPTSHCLMTGYLASLQPETAMKSSVVAMSKRREWNQEGYRYTTLLLTNFDKVRGDKRKVIIDLLGGTHDDRAAVGLKKMLRRDISGGDRLEIYAALAELGYYTRYHSSLLLQEVRRARLARDGQTHTRAAIALATIQHTEASWAQDQLYQLRLVDGGLSEQIGPLLRLRDYALKSANGR